MKSIRLSDIATLPVEQRLQLVEDIWDSIQALPEAIAIPEWHRQELEKRLRDYHENPESGTPWSDIREKYLAS